MQTATSWLQEQIFNSDWKNMSGEDKLKLFEQAKKMEQGEICLAFLEGQHHSEKLPSQYYIDTYGSKGSDDQVPDVRKMDLLEDIDDQKIAMTKKSAN